MVGNFKLLLLIIFAAALFIRFLFFPINIYFGYDQARDAYNALEIFHGHLKLIGPTTSFPGLNHGVLYYYLLVPLYGLTKMNPEWVAAVMRIFNAVGVLLIFYLGKILFNKWIGLLAAFLFAISFEQTQFAIYMGNPSLGSLSVMLMYLGLALVIFQKKFWGLALATLGFGLSVQFQFASTYLVVPFLLILIFFRKSILRMPIKIWSWSAAALVITLSTFILAELKYNFRAIHSLLALSQINSYKTIVTIFNTYFFTISRMFKYNLVGEFPWWWIVGIILMVVIWWMIKQREYRSQLIFLLIWFLGVLITFLIHGGVENLQKDVPLYYPNVGVSISLLIFVAFSIYQIFLKSKILAAAVVLLIVLANFHLIWTLNYKGTISEIDVQQGMLLGDQKKVLDYLYQTSGGQPFAVKAVTLPFDVNTTWSYLFEWYGKDKYGYLPIWNGKNALGFPGNLLVQETQENLPNNRYVIIEPTRGIAPHLIDNFLQEENYFTKVIAEKKFGQIIVQEREKF